MAKGVKTGGRKAGTPNKLTKELRATLKSVVDQELDNLPELMSKLEDKDRLALLLKLLPYVIPKVNSVSSTSDEPFDWNMT